MTQTTVEAGGAEREPAHRGEHAAPPITEVEQCSRRSSAAVPPAIVTAGGPER